MNLFSLFAGALITGVIGFFMFILKSEDEHQKQILLFRQEWINKVRSVFIETIEVLRVLLFLSKSNNDFVFTIDNEEIRLLVRCLANISLYLNPEEDDNKNLIKNINEFLLFLVPTQYPKLSMLSGEKKVKKIENIMQRILKREWKRVRDGETKYKQQLAINSQKEQQREE